MERDSLIKLIQNTSPTSYLIACDIAAYFEERAIPGNGFFLNEGSIVKEYMYLEEGFMRAYTFDLDGNEVTTAFYSKNNIVFEASSFFTNTRSKENIQALTDCEGYVITYEQLNILFHSIPEFRDFGRAVLVKTLVALKQRTLSLINEPAEKRYENLINSDPGILQQAKLKYIASYLGITDTSLSRIRKEYSRKQ